MVPGNGYVQKDQEKQKNILVRFIAFIARWYVGGFLGFIKSFKDIGLGDAEQKLIFEIIVLTDQDEMIWRSCDESIEAFEASRNDIPFRLEIIYNGPILFTTHADVKARIFKGASLDFLVEAIFKQEARNHRKEEIKNFDPDEEFKRVLGESYKEFLKRRP